MYAQASLPDRVFLPCSFAHLYPRAFGKTARDGNDYAVPVVQARKDFNPVIQPLADRHQARMNLIVLRDVHRLQLSSLHNAPAWNSQNLLLAGFETRSSE